jgi:hypothetical protein
MEGKDGVPLRFPRPVMALIATGTAATAIALAAVPASADQVRHNEWWLGSLGVTSAWSASQGSGVTVAVLSDGVVASNADLAGAVTTAGPVAGAPVATRQYFGEQGTSIASLIAGRGHGAGGADGIVGVAPKARILSVPVTLPPDDPQLGQASVAAAIPAAIAAGIRYAVAHGATVIDLPLDPSQAGSNGIAGATAGAGGSAAEKAAVSYALAHNVVLVAPAGDDYTAGDGANYPAAYPGVMAVGAFDTQFNKAPFSSRQRYVTLTAAGAGVVASSSTGGYVTMNSTSAASAVVAGVVALIRARYPSLTVANVRQVLITTTTYRRAGGLATGSGYGAVDAAQAMTAAAVLGTSPADRASAGARPLRQPTAVTAPPARQTLGAQILRAGEVSASLLLVLLLLIAGYAAVGRRRSRRRTAVTAEWMHRQSQSRYPQASSTDADRMLEVFAVPAPVPAGAAAPARSPAQAGDLVRYQRGADGVFAPTGGRAPAGYPGTYMAAGVGLSARPVPVSGPPAIGGGPAVSGSSDNGWMPLGPASRAVSGRAAVSGAPPWEPAMPPDGELPWTAAAGKHGNSARREVARPGDERAAAQDDADQSSPAQSVSAQSVSAQSLSAQSVSAQSLSALAPATRSRSAQTPPAQSPATQSTAAQAITARRRAAQTLAAQNRAAPALAGQPPAEQSPAAQSSAAQSSAARPLPTRTPAAPSASRSPRASAEAAPPAVASRSGATAGPASASSPWSSAAQSPSRPAGQRSAAYGNEPPGWDAIPPDLRRVSEPPDWDAIPPSSAGAGQPGWDPSVRPSKFDPQQPPARFGSAASAATPAKFEWPTRFGGRTEDAGPSGYGEPSHQDGPYQYEMPPRYDAPPHYGAPTAWDAPSQYRSAAPYVRQPVSDHDASAELGSPAFRSPTGFRPGTDSRSAPGGIAAPGRHSSTGEGGARRSPGESGNGAADGASEPDQSSAPRYAASGLPVRQPRGTRPANPAPLSPSGSLWEPVSSEAAKEPRQAGDADSAGRPIFVWNPATARESAD